MQKRLFIVSNRLPVTVEQTAAGTTCRPSSGGLVSAVGAYMALAGHKEFAEAVWAGVPGCSEKMWQQADPGKDCTDYTCLPVFLNWKKYELYYNGFSNSLLWPLFHYFPSFADYNTAYYEAYMEANELFADILAKDIRKGDVVWIHDYHLLPLARMLRARCPSVTIGFFLHIPFPSYELFRVLPKLWQKELLEGMLGADLIGFQTQDYADHFLAAAGTILKLTHDDGLIPWDNRQVKAAAFPISIDFDLFHEVYDDPRVADARQQFLAQKGDKKVIFSVDRLDYTKGVSNRLKGYELFLQQHPEYLGKVMFVLIIVPSRNSLTRYAERKQMIDEFIGNLNSRLGTISWQPVVYRYRHLLFDELLALYTACDLALITPLRDGMNLVAKEFVASRKDRRGVLVLSELAGAARELTEALLINPNDTAEIAEMIRCGLEMPAEEQEQRMAAMQAHISRHDVTGWAAGFFGQLQQVKQLQPELTITFLDNVARVQLLDRYAAAARRLVLLDYDGTLAPFASRPELAAPGPELLRVLEALAGHPQNDVFIISGRDSATLEGWLGHLPVGLIAEHGVKIRHKDGQWTVNALARATEWRQPVAAIMERFVAACPGSFIEEKEFSLVWHYRNVEKADGEAGAAGLYDALLEHTRLLPLHVLNGNKVIEVRVKGVNKGTAAEGVLKAGQYDFILAAGDDVTDEDMFLRLAGEQQAFTIKVGNEASFARYNLHNPAMVLSLLETLSLYAPARV